MDFSSIPTSLAENDLANFSVPKPGGGRREIFLSNSRAVESEIPEYLYAGIALYHPKILMGQSGKIFHRSPFKNLRFRKIWSAAYFPGSGTMWALPIDSVPCSPSTETNRAACFVIGPALRRFQTKFLHHIGNNVLKGCIGKP